MIAALIALALHAFLASGQVIEPVRATLGDSQYDLATEGRTFLIREASSASFFLLGELHGDNETQALVRALWPAMWDAGYRHVAAELSPWMANHLSAKGITQGILRHGSWSRTDVEDLARRASGSQAVLWGADIEEVIPQLLLGELGAVNPGNQELRAAVDLSKLGYQRKMAPALLAHVEKAGAVKDIVVGGASLRENVLRTLEVEVDRMNANTRLRASMRREAVMKALFHKYWQDSGRPRAMLRFGRNHLHRGMDRRGVSTLGNFVVELAAANGGSAFNVAEFSAGGSIFWPGQLVDFDERGDDPAFAFLASIARHPATVFDLRPVRQALHQIPEAKRTPAEASLVYWADTYDAIICFKEVTPRRN